MIAKLAIKQRKSSIAAFVNGVKNCNKNIVQDESGRKEETMKRMCFVVLAALAIIVCIIAFQRFWEGKKENYVMNVQVKDALNQ